MFIEDTEYTLRSDRVLIRPILREETTLSGIYLPPDSGAIEPQTALVLDVGPGRYLTNGDWLPMTVKPGDRVVYTPFKGMRISKEKVLIIDESEILAIID